MSKDANFSLTLKFETYSVNLLWKNFWWVSRRKEVESMPWNAQKVRSLCGNLQSCAYQFGYSLFKDSEETIHSARMLPRMNLLCFSYRKPPKIFLNNPITKNQETKQKSFQGFVNSQYFFMKISWIGPWVSRIDWCEEHLSGSTYIVLRLSNKSSKTA